MTTEDTVVIIDSLTSINETAYWIVSFQVVNMCLLTISLFFIALKAGKS